MSKKGQNYRVKRITSLKPLSDAHRGYIAGILDGEGHVYVRGEYEGTCYSKVRVRITDESLALFLKRITGIGSVCSHIPNQRRKDGELKRRVYEWQVGNRADVCALLKNIMPYLLIKKQRAKWVLEYEMLKTQGVGNGVEARRIIDLIASAQTHGPKRAGRDGLRTHR